MFFRTPDFWYGRTGFSRFISFALTPFSCVYAAAGALRMVVARPQKISVPVVCVGNLVAGGAGKTPAVTALAKLLQRQGRKPHIVLRGYGGALRGPVGVDPEVHSYLDVGDEALLLASAAPTWVACDRVAGGRAAQGAGADIVLLDDGFQNPHLHKDFSFIVVDGETGFGNGLVMPAGPLREPLRQGLARAQGAVVMGSGHPDGLGNMPVVRARVVPEAGLEKLRNSRAVAFAGIGRPEKFKKTLEDAGVEIVFWRAYADHKPYGGDEIRKLAAKAERERAFLLTTEKDWMRLPRDCRPLVRTVPVFLAWENENAVLELLAPVLE